MISKHSHERLQQRAIPDMIVSLLLDYGSPQRSCGADTFLIDKAARKAISRAVGGDRNMRIIEPFLNVKIVVGDDGTIVTAARRTRRVRRR